MSLVSSFLIALLLTILIELAVAWFFGFRKKVEIETLVFVNLLTNPVLNYFLLVNGHYSFFKINLVITLLLELLVVIVEWKLLTYALQEKSNRFFALSFAMNLCSYIAGILMFT